MMRYSLVLAALSFAVVANAQNFSSYVPDCAPPCVEQTLQDSKVCTGLDDNECLCTNLAQILFPSRQCFIQTCGAGNPNDLRTEIISGWQKFCNDSGTPANFSGGFGSGGPPGIPFTSSSTTSSITTSASPVASPTASSDVTPAPLPASTASSDLSTGAKAGIGVGVGVGSLAVIGGLVFLGFRLGQKRTRARQEGVEDTEDFVGGEGGRTGDGYAYGSTASPLTLPTTATGTLVEGGGDHAAADKIQSSRDATLAELPSPSSPRAELPAHDVKELPAQEHPAELWHGVMPPELSADAEVPRDRIAGLPRYRDI
ncbi:hypothetical protein SAMD00023353_5600150 [Rosellinia necatrix]|uniref:CFEM domain-containing protein n=1 Tax=Rosellinia necatrix TaxID=77044 RepID=A0A1W2TRL6_ROSNE|nr:hypothetical protein SAMD00023353_5600150 [Rosellinia necatrix]